MGSASDASWDRLETRIFSGDKEIGRRKITFRYGESLHIANALVYPHPVRRATAFTYMLSGSAEVEIEIYALTGRLIRNTLQQGNTHEAVAYFRERDGNVPVIEGYQDGKLDCSNTATADGGAVELCLHDGGHSVRGEWIKRGWMRLAAFKGWTEFQQAAKTSK